MLSRGKLTSMSIFLRLKSLFGNSCIYKATYENISRKSGISISTLKRHLPLLKEETWVEMCGETMLFRRMFIVDDCIEQHIVGLKICDNDTYKDIEKKLKLLLVRVPYEGRVAMAKKKNQSNDCLPAEREMVKMANATVSRFIGASRSTASRLMRWAEKKGILRIKENFTIYNYSDMFVALDAKKSMGGNAVLIRSKRLFVQTYRGWEGAPACKHQLANSISFN